MCLPEWSDRRKNRKSIQFDPYFMSTDEKLVIIH
jgi:hypothetical protein